MCKLCIMYSMENRDSHILYLFNEAQDYFESIVTICVAKGILSMIAFT